MRLGFLQGQQLHYGAYSPGGLVADVAPDLWVLEAGMSEAGRYVRHVLE